eukprot:gene18403-25935_t
MLCALMIPAASGGVKAGVARGVQATRRCVPQDAGDELIRGQGERLELVVTMIQIRHAQGVPVQVEAAMRRHRATLGIACQIEQHTAAVVVGRADLDVPVLAVQLADER